MKHKDLISFSGTQKRSPSVQFLAPFAFYTKSLLLISLSVIPAYADDAVDTEQQTDRQTRGHIEAGIIYQSDDSPWFGRYTGLTEAGTRVLGDLDVRSNSENGTHTRLTGRRLGLDSQSILLEHGLQGRYKLEFRHDELPDYRSNSGVTPYIDSDNNTLILPNGVADAQHYQPVELKTLRRRNQAEISLIPHQNWKTSFSYRQERKDGTLQTGGALGYSTRNMAMATLPKPVDHTTDLLDASLSYAKDRGNIELAYHLSMFRNQNQSLSWQNPFPDASENVGAFGQMALEPDNDFHQLMLSGGYRLPANSYLTTVLSSGRMTQDQAFLPYTTNPDIATQALPAGSLNGSVKQNIAQLKLSTRPLRNWNFNASYRYHDHDNNSPQAAYVFPMLDSLPPGKKARTKTN